MAPTPVEPEHFNPVLITVLPRQRRARHPYQLAPMAMLIIYGAWQLAAGLLPTSVMQVLNLFTQDLLSVACIIAGLLGIAAAFIPEHVIRVFGRQVDATWIRLGEEMVCHMTLFVVWLALLFVAWTAMDDTKGASFVFVAAICYGPAAVVRAWQIWATMRPALRANDSAATAMLLGAEGGDPTIVLGTEDARADPGDGQRH